MMRIQGCERLIASDVPHYYLCALNYRDMAKVLHIISGLGAGGAQRVLARLIAATSPQWCHHVVSLVDSSEGAAHDGIPAGIIDGLGLRGIGDLPVALRRLSVVARKFQPCLIQGWMYHGNLAAWMCSLLGARAPVVWNIRHSPEGDTHQGFATKLTVKANALLSRSAAAIIFNSVRSMNLHKQLGFAGKRMRVIPNGFDTCSLALQPAWRQSWRIARGIPANAVVFGHAARLHSVKNHLGAVRAFAAIAAERPDVWLAMVGEGVNVGSSELLEAAQSPSCRGRVLLLDRETQMTQFYNGIDVLLLSSWAEAMPNVIGEAMACATPCITTDVGDAASLVGDTGWIAESPTAESLLTSLRDASRLTRQELQDRGQRARVRIENEFSLERMVNSYTDLYTGVMAAAAHSCAFTGSSHG